MNVPFKVPVYLCTYVPFKYVIYPRTRSSSNNVTSDVSLKVSSGDLHNLHRIVTLLTFMKLGLLLFLSSPLDRQIGF